MQQESNKPQSDRFETTVARTLGEVEAIRPIWEQMQSNQSYPIINADIDRYLSVLESQKDRDIRSHVILLQRHDGPEAMVIGRVEKRQLHCRIGYKDIFKPLVRCLTVVYGGILGDQNDVNCDAIMKELHSTLRRGEVDLVLMRQLRTDSMIYRFAKEMPSFLCRDHFMRVENHWSMSVPENLGEFYQSRSKKHRGNLKRYIKKLERAYPGQVKMITYRKEDGLDDAIEAASQISAKTYQNAMGCGFVDDFRTRTLLSAATKLGWLRAHILYIDDEPIAYRFALHHGRTYFADGIGFDPKWSKWRVGTILFLKVLENLCRDGAVDCYDFGFGDADYKRSYGDKQWQEASVYIFAARFRPVCVNLLHSAVAGLSLGLNYLSDKAGFTRWVKRCWRNHLQGKKE